MTLEEYIDSVIEENPCLYIGTSGGAFVWIGYASEAKEGLETTSEGFNGIVRGKLKDARGEIKYLKSRIPDVESQIEEYESLLARKQGDLKRAEAEYVSHCKSNIARHESKIRTLKRSISGLEKDIVRKRSILSRYRETEKQLKESIPGLVKLDNAFVPFINREIVSIYEKKIFEPFGYAVEIDGKEMGKYWLYEEMIYGIEEDTEEDYEVVGCEEE